MYAVVPDFIDKWFKWSLDKDGLGGFKNFEIIA